MAYIFVTLDTSHDPMLSLKVFKVYTDPLNRLLMSVIREVFQALMSSPYVERSPPIQALTADTRALFEDGVNESPNTTRDVHNRTERLRTDIMNEFETKVEKEQVNNCGIKEESNWCQRGARLLQILK